MQCTQLTMMHQSDQLTTWIVMNYFFVVKFNKCRLCKLLQSNLRDYFPNMEYLFNHYYNRTLVQNNITHYFLVGGRGVQPLFILTLLYINLTLTNITNIPIFMLVNSNVYLCMWLFSSLIQSTKVLLVTPKCGITFGKQLNC